MSQAILFQRFGSKERLFFAAMMPPPPDIDAILAPLDADAAPANLRAVCRSIYRHFAATVPSVLHLTTHPAFEVAHLGEAHDHLLAAELSRRLTDGLAQTRAGEDPRRIGAAAHTLIAIAHTAALHSAIGHHPPGPDAESTLDAMVDAVWFGLRPDPAA